jgi:hypothetical protein
MPMTRIVLSLPEDTLAMVTQLAGLRRRSVSEEIRQAIYVALAGQGAPAITENPVQPVREEVIRDFDFGA